MRGSARGEALCKFPIKWRRRDLRSTLRKRAREQRNTDKALGNEAPASFFHAPPFTSEWGNCPSGGKHRALSFPCKHHMERRQKTPPLDNVLLGWVCAAGVHNRFPPLGSMFCRMPPIGMCLREMFEATRIFGDGRMGSIVPL